MSELTILCIFPLDSDRFSFRYLKKKNQRAEILLLACKAMQKKANKW